MRLPSRLLTEFNMEVTLLRTYYRDGTNGIFLYGKDTICESIELPWKANQKQRSCIPEGHYRLTIKYLPVTGRRLMVTNVPGRSGILIHCANDAIRELKGCIAPVTKATAPGKGIYSRIALERLEDLILTVIEAREAVHLVVKSSSKPL